MLLQSAKKLRTMNLWMGFYSFAGVDVVSCITNFNIYVPQNFFLQTFLLKFCVYFV